LPRPASSRALATAAAPVMPRVAVEPLMACAALENEWHPAEFAHDLAPKTLRAHRLIVEWRWAPGTPGSNSGVLMRITGKPQALPKCAEAQLKHGSAGDIYGFHGFQVKGDAKRIKSAESERTGKLSGVSKIKDMEKKPGEWNKYEITFKGGDLTLIINGEKVNEANSCDVVAGKIGLQSEGGEIHFRTVRLVPLGSQ